MRRPRPRRPAWALVLLAAPLGIATAQPAQPAPAAVDDPLLAPPAEATTVVASWEEARRMLVAGSIDLRRADAAVARAEGQVRQAYAGLLPRAQATVAGTLDVAHPDTAPGVPSGAGDEPTSPLGTAAVTATQPIIDLAARRGLAAARADRAAVALSRADEDRLLARDLAHAMLAVQATSRAAELARLGLRQALERAAITRRTFQLGAATDLDVVRVEQDVAVARSAVIAGDEDVRVARESLGLLLGVDGEVGLAADLTGDALLAGVTAQCRPLRDGELRADLASADAAIEAAVKRTDEARAGYYPTLDFSTAAFAYTTDPAPGRLATWTVTLTLSVPIWEGGLRAGLIAERRAAEAAARVEAEASRRSARVEVTRAERGDDVARSLVDAATASRTLAERVDTMTRRSFEIGRATSLELVQSASALRLADLTLTAREFDLAAARIDELLTEARCER
jgi:outer membrane protein TolC